MLDDAAPRIGSRPQGHEQFAICIKAGVQAAICIQPDQAEVIVAAVVAARTGHDQLAIALLNDTETDVIARPYGHEQFATCTKTGVQAAIGIQADQAEISITAIEAVPGQDQLAIALLDDASSLVDGRPDRHDGFTWLARERGRGVGGHQHMAPTRLLPRASHRVVNRQARLGAAVKRPTAAVFVCANRVAGGMDVNTQCIGQCVDEGVTRLAQAAVAAIYPTLGTLIQRLRELEPFIRRRFNGLCVHPGAAQQQTARFTVAHQMQTRPAQRGGCVGLLVQRNDGLQRLQRGLIGLYDHGPRMRHQGLAQRVEFRQARIQQHQVGGGGWLEVLRSNESAHGKTPKIDCLSIKNQSTPRPAQAGARCGFSCALG